MALICPLGIRAKVGTRSSCLLAMSLGLFGNHGLCSLTSVTWDNLCCHLTISYLEYFVLAAVPDRFPVIPACTSESEHTFRSFLLPRVGIVTLPPRSLAHPSPVGCVRKAGGGPAAPPRAGFSTAVSS